MPEEFVRPRTFTGLWGNSLFFLTIGLLITGIVLVLEGFWAWMVERSEAQLANAEGGTRSAE